jgi:signal transduction histidine kinase
MTAFPDNPDTGSLQPKELEAVYAISRAVVQAEDVDVALDQIIRLTRSVFIFDNMVLYINPGNDALEPRYARVIGRGRSREANLAWGDNIAYDVFRSAQTLIHHEKLDGWQNDRLSMRLFLGIPLRLRDGMMGALVFGRFGGPPYTPEQIHLAEFIASHVTQLLRRQQLVERIASLEAERRLSRLQADFIAMVSHELCTPLGFIKGYATTLLREDTTWDEATRREFLTIIDEEADRLRELIDDLLDSSRLQAGTLFMEFQPVRLDALIREASSRIRTRNESLTINLELKPGVIVYADPTRLAQVFDNLMNNAVKYAPGAPVTITLDKKDGKVHIAVRDTGPGIAAEHQAHLFERFYRVPGSRDIARGTGLGLFICRQITQAHSGEITVESSVGQGTTFHIYLPLSQTDQEKSTM